MSATKHPNVGPPTNPPVVRRTFSTEGGEIIEHEWPKGTKEELLTLYNQYMASMRVGSSVGNIEYQNSEGKGTLKVKYGRTGQQIEGEPDTVAMAEEVIAVDVIKDISEAPYFDALTDNQIAEVRLASEEGYDTDQITALATKDQQGMRTIWANWTTAMKELRHHYLHGVSNYYETGFVLRRVRFCVRTSETLLTFTDINRVVAPPTFRTDMFSLFENLPTGEWLYRPPQAEYLGRGKWRTTQEWHWATQWSVVYGGTWQL